VGLVRFVLAGRVPSRFALGRHRMKETYSCRNVRNLLRTQAFPNFQHEREIRRTKGASGETCMLTLPGSKVSLHIVPDRRSEKSLPPHNFEA
jgi:hypothetical protein